MISNKRMHVIITECINSVLTEADRHREGYYDDYAKKTGRKDRHSADYYRKYREKKKQEKELNGIKDQSKPTASKKKTDRREYYRKYNQEHPERFNRGFTKGYNNGNVKDGLKHDNQEDFLGRRILGYDELGLPITNDPLGDALRRKEMEWHDDDWCEDID